VPDRIRAFVALTIPQPQRDQLGAYVAEGGRLAPGHRWVQPEALHLTLRFLGHVEPVVLARVSAGLALVRAAPFRLGLGGVGTFGPRPAPRVVWLGITEGLAACAALAAAVERMCREAGLEAESRGFRAHVTLARARDEGARLPDLPEPPRLEPWTVSELVLFESRLGGQAGPRYLPLDTYRLQR
jgi:2'-5' RNA ligase